MFRDNSMVGTGDLLLMELLEEMTPISRLDPNFDCEDL